LPEKQSASGNVSACRNARLSAWYAPSEQPAVTISAAVPVSPRMCGTTRSRIHDSYVPCCRARSSSGRCAADQVPESYESTQYSLTRPASTSPATASTIPFAANSQALPPSVGNHRTGRPQWP
jgi:hypothetical protein